MKINMIDVQTSNKKHATDIAMLVNNTEFHGEIGRLRQKWQITKLKSTKGLLPNHIRLLDFKGIIKSKFNDPDESVKKFQEFNKDIDVLLEQFKKGKNFRLVVLYALFAGVIPNGIYQSCYFDVVTINEPEDINKPENYQYVIVLSPRTEQQEIVKAYKEFKNHIKGKIKFHQPRISLDSEATKEFYEAMDCIKKEKKLCDEEIEKHNTPEEINNAIAKYLINTSKARDYLLQVGDLDIDIPDHHELIEQYYKGDVHEYDDIDKHKTLKQFHRNREFYMISYKDVLEGKSKEPLTASKVYKIWVQKCPLNGHLKLKDDRRVDCSCQYCTLFDTITIEKGIDAYIEFLEKINKTGLNY